MKHVIILRGASGSGKSTYAEKLCKDIKGGYIIVSADHFFTSSTGKYAFNHAQLGTAHAVCMKNFVQAVTRECPTIIVDNTNTRLHEISPYRQVALAYDYEVEIIRTVCGATEAYRRNIHGVPEHTISAQTKRMEKLPRFWEKETLVYT